MTDRAATTRLRPALRRLATGGALTLALLSGCAGAPTPANASAVDETVGAALPEGEAIERLRTLAVRQRSRPAHVDGVPIPAGIEPHAVGTLEPDDADPRAREPLAGVVRRLAEPMRADAEPAEPADRERRDAALRLYTSGRLKRLAGDGQEAVRDLERARDLDPRSGAIWRELAEAQREAGLRAQSVRSFSRAVELGVREARPLYLIGADAARAGRHETAAEALAAAAGALSPTDDGALPLLIHAALGEALHELGYLRAGNEALARGLDIPSSFVTGTVYRAELSNLLRRRSDLRREAGDAWCRLGDYARAADAYAAAAADPTLDPDALLVRRVYAMMKLGRPAEAALLLLARIAESGGLVDPRHVGLLRALGRTPVASTVADAVDELRREMTDAPRTVRIGLARAAAAPLPPVRARERLRAAVADGLASRRLADDLLGSLERPSPSRAADEAIALVRASPDAARLWAAALLNHHPKPPALLDVLDAHRDPEAALLRALVLLELDRPRGALETIERADERRRNSRLGHAFRVAEIRAGALCGRWDVVAAALPATADAPLALRIEALRAAQRFDGAFEIAREHAEAASYDAAPDVLIAAAELALAVGRPAFAERALRAGLDADPYDERFYEGLLTIYSEGAPAENEAALTEIARRLRDRIPSSELMRVLAAQELLQRGLLAEAEQRLLELADGWPVSPVVIDRLVQTWQALARTGNEDAFAEGEAWLRARLDRRPASGIIARALATVLVQQDRHGDAIEVLERALDAGAPASLEQVIEQVVGARGDEEERRRLALQRLGHEPRSIPEAIELAELLVGQDEAARAGEALNAALPAEASLTAEQSRRVLLIASRVVIAAEREPRGSESRRHKRTAALALLDLAEQRRLPVPAPVHESRLGLIAEETDTSVDRLLSAAAFAGEQHERLRSVAFARAARLLLERERRSAAVDLITRAVAETDDPEEDLIIEAVRLVAGAGEGEDGRLLIDRLDGAGLLLRAIEIVRSEPEIDPSDHGAVRAELAYTLAGLAMVFDREDASESFYRLALEEKPGHPWASNDLGYTLLERDGPTDEVESLLLDAYERLSDRASVVDSLGWLRYRQGRFLDRDGPDGEGAVTLLARAAAKPEGASNPTIMDHYGDALWMAGRRTEAVETWEAAEVLVLRELREVRREESPIPARLSRLETLNQSVRAKLRAAELGEPPPVAESRGEPIAPEPHDDEPPHEPPDGNVHEPPDDPPDDGEHDPDDDA